MDRAMDRKRDEERLTKAEWEKQQREDLLADKKETYKDYPKEDIEDYFFSFFISMTDLRRA